jgi:hypothetical protein
VQDEQMVAGRYPFAIYQWQKRGLREDMVFQPVSNDPALTREFLRLMQTAHPLDGTESELPEQSVFDALEAIHAQIWVQARDEHQAAIQRLAAYRLESLQRSHQAQNNVLRDRLAQVHEERIRRLYEGQIANAETDFQRRGTAIEEAVNRADILTQRVAFGIIIVEHATESPL